MAGSVQTLECVLVVDDERVMLRFIGTLLVDSGLCVHTATGAVDALRIAASARPDLILLDLHMEPCDGFETCARLKSDPATAAIPVLFLTGDTDKAAVVRGLGLGAVDYVVKPFEPAVLLARVRTHLTLGRLIGRLRREVAARTADLTAANARLKRLSAEIALAQEREHRRLAEGLHDGVIQSLALARMRIGTRCECGAPGGEVAAILDGAIADLRALVFDLSPPELHALGLEAALGSLVERTRARFPVALALRTEGALDPLPPDLAVLAFQGARELIANLIRHAGARSGLILAERDGARLRICVIDDGVGLAESRVGTGFGLFSLRQRLESLLALSMHADGCFVRRMVDAGASGYVLKTAQPEDLLAAVRMETYRRRLMHKLAIRHIPGLVVYALRHGYLRLDALAGVD